jgi:hypothetical protein
LWAEGRYKAFKPRFEKLAEGSDLHSTKGRNASYAALAEFPPKDLPEGTAVADVEPEVEDNAGLPAAPYDDTIDLLVELGDVESADIVGEIRWAYSRLAAYLDAEARKDRHAMRSIELQAPNTGAVQMLRAAASNSNKFTLEVVPKFLGGGKDESEREKELRKQTRRQLTMVEEILAEVRCPKCNEVLG